jgi:hypothetical protein
MEEKDAAGNVQNILEEMSNKKIEDTIIQVKVPVFLGLGLQVDRFNHFHLDNTGLSMSIHVFDY